VCARARARVPVYEIESAQGKKIMHAYYEKEKKKIIIKKPYIYTYCMVCVCTLDVICARGYDYQSRLCTTAEMEKKNSPSGPRKPIPAVSNTKKKSFSKIIKNIYELIIYLNMSVNGRTVLLILV